jgi:cytochrome oxidase assembly protein ShyY1
VYRFLLTRRWLGLLAVALLVAATCALLGRWQVHRLEAQHANNHLITRNASASPVPAPELLGVGRGPAESREYARVRATGHYDTAHRLLVRNRPHEGQVGFYVVLPLVTADGPALLVNRGWVPAGESATDVPDVPAPPAGDVTVVGRVRPSESAATRGGTPPPGQVTRIDVPQIAKDLPYDVYGGYADLVRERPAPRRAPVAIDAPETSEGPHLAYAFQWFLFACLALGGYVVLARREAADRRAAAPGETVSVPVRISG